MLETKSWHHPPPPFPFHGANGQETVQVGFGRTTPYNRTFMIQTGCAH